MGREPSTLSEGKRLGMLVAHLPHRHLHSTPLHPTSPFTLGLLSTSPVHAPVTLIAPPHTPPSHPLKTLLHVAGVVTTLSLALVLFWRPTAGPAAWWHIRVLLALRCGAAVLGKSRMSVNECPPIPLTRRPFELFPTPTLTQAPSSCGPASRLCQSWATRAAGVTPSCSIARPTSLI